MNAHIKRSETAVSRRQVMIGAAGFSFAIVLGGRADAAVVAGERTGQALSPWVRAWPVRSPATTAASARPPRAIAKEKPAAPIITWRRDTAVSDLLICAFMSRLPRRALNRAHDALIGAATANVGAHVFDDLLARRLRLCLSRSAALIIWPDWQ